MLKNISMSTILLNKIECRIAIALAFLFGLKKWHYILGFTVNFWVCRLNQLTKI